MNKKKYVILELIPTRLSNGEIVQISALKLDGLKLLDRFDYRLKLDMISNPDILRIISYDKDTKILILDTNDSKTLRGKINFSTKIPSIR